MANTDAGVGGRSVERKLQRLYRNKNGEEVTKLTGDATHCVWVVIKTKERVELELGALSDAMKTCAMAFGINTSVGNVAGPIEDPAKMAAALRDRVETIMEGEWRSGREGGPRVKGVIEAWATYFAAKGTEVSDAQREALKAKIVAGEVTVDGLLGIPGIKAAYDKAIADEAAKRAAESAAAATGDADASAFDPSAL